MGIFDWLFGGNKTTTQTEKKETQHQIQENGICKIYTEKGNLLTVFNLSEGLLDGKFQRFIPDTSYEGQVTQQEHLILNFKQGKLHGKCSEYDNIRGVYKFIENFNNGVLISSQMFQRSKGQENVFGSATKYELGAVITDKKILKEKGSFIEKFQLESPFGPVSELRKKGVQFKLLAD